MLMDPGENVKRVGMNLGYTGSHPLATPNSPKSFHTHTAALKEPSSSLGMGSGI